MPIVEILFIGAVGASIGLFLGVVLTLVAFRNLGRKKPKIGEPNWEKCTCPWQLGMGPELHCPVHGRPDLIPGDEVSV
ncbi:hypothetical protein ES703_114513 [subsurface metagenome]